VKAPGGGGGVAYPSGGTPGDSLVWVGPGQNDVAWATINSAYANIGVNFDGAGSLLGLGSFCDVVMPWPCTIISNELLVDPSGTVVVDIYKSTYAAYPPVVGGKITASAPLNVSAGVKSVDTTLTGWSTTLLQGDILRFILTTTILNATKAMAMLRVLK
jgi:hypothetical protein